VKVARENLKAAKGKDARRRALQALQDAITNEEATEFDRRLSDAQTAEELGRMSHKAYMRYLQSEHDRLEAIKKKTRQQQEQLDQIDRLMKAAADEVSGMFNFGSIKLPSVYEVRRMMTAGLGNVAGRVTQYTDDSTRTVHINGTNLSAADIAKAVSDVLGTSVTQYASV
jgi:predicted phage tail protein